MKTKITVDQKIKYMIEWRGKNWAFTDLESAREIYAEKDSEGKKPKLFEIKETVTTEIRKIAV